MRKIKFLLATIMMLVGITAQATTITWDAAKLNSMRISIESTEPASQSKTSDGITVTVAKTVSSAIYYTMEFYSNIMANSQGYFTFESSVGNISKIEINHSSLGSWSSGGTGWPDDYMDYDGGGTFTWSGTPAASVTLSGTQGDGFYSISSIVFTIEDPTVAVTSVTLDKTEAALNIGESVTLTATVAPDDATDKTVTWTSSDATVATVSDEGVVTAVAAGTATITVTTTDGAKTATCTVTVAEPTYTVTVKDGTEDAANWTITPTSAKAGETVTITYTGTKKVKSVKAVVKAAPIPVTAITLNKTATEIKVGSTETLSVTAVAPEDATDQTVTWSSDNAAVASVDALTGVVTAVATGTANITATANDGSGVTATCAVTVAPAISFSKIHWAMAMSAPANFISVSQTDAKAAADAEKTRANAPGYVCIYALEGGSYKWFDSHGRSGQGSIEDIANGDAWDEVYECHQAGDSNSIWFTVSQ